MLPETLDHASLFPPPDRARWLELVNADLKGAPFERRLVTHTYEGIHVQPLYTAADLPERLAESSGLMPLTRGADALGTSPSGWDIRQEHGQADPARAAAAIREDLQGGVTSIVVRLDACARAGLDPTDPRGALLCGGDGVSVHTADDLDRLLDGVHLDMIGLWLEAGAAFVPAAGALAAVWARRGVSPDRARGGFQADPLAVLARDGHLPYSLDDGLARLGELAAWTSRTYPHVRGVRVGTAPYHHAGATATQDLAFAMASGLEYLRAMTRAGLGIDAAAGQIVFSLAVGCNMFLAVAKLRAARRLWARVVEACGGGEDAARMRMYVRPSKRVLTTRDAWVNMLRSTACVLAAGLGGADAIGCTPFDAPLGEPSELGRRLARNTHHLLMEECGVHKVCDPAGGSYYLERLTEELAQKAWVILQAIESRGGMAACLLNGWVHEQIDSAAQPRVSNLATRKDVVVGVSDFPAPAASELHKRPVDRGPVVAAACSRLAMRTGVPRAEAGPRERRIEWVVDRMAAGASIGEACAALGTGGVPASLHAAVHVHPFAEPFERLREAAEHYAAECGHPPRVFIAALGTRVERLARVNFCRNLFEAGGFEVVGDQAEGTPEAAAEAFAASGSRLAAIAGPDALYEAGMPWLAGALHRSGARRVILAGNPGERERAYRAAGVDGFVFVKCDVVRLLTELLAQEGVHA